jgi:hypothetical protein
MILNCVENVSFIIVSPVHDRTHLMTNWIPKVSFATELRTKVFPFKKFGYFVGTQVMPSHNQIYSHHYKTLAPEK